MKSRSQHQQQIISGIAAAALAGTVIALPTLEHALASRQVGQRLDRASLSATARPPDLLSSSAAQAAAQSWLDAPASPSSAAAAAGVASLAGWQTIGGCGGGAGGGAGVGIKWIGRNVTGGLFHLEMQGNYEKKAYGYDYSAVTLLTRDLDDKWTLGVSIPYLYKYMNDPYGLYVDVANKGPGDVNVMVTRRFGAINDTSVMLGVGLPSGTHDAVFRTTELLPQERQLGMGKPTASMVIDHTIDNLWGNYVLGGTVAYRGGENELGNYRSPSGSLYSYVSYLFGPFVPAFGVSVNGWQDHDRDRGGAQETPLFSVAGSASLEYATDWAALLIGASLPYQYDGIEKDANGRAQNPWRMGEWLFGVGLALAPF